MKKDVTLSDIAEALGVSTVTVSKALSGKKGVSEEMRIKIKELADELGYKQPSAARRGNDGKSYSIGCLIHEIYLEQGDSFYLQMYRSVTMQAALKDYFTMMEIISIEQEKKQKLPKMVEEEKIDGLIIIGKIKDTYLEYLNESMKIPFIYLDFCNQRQDMDAVISDSFYGAYCLTNYLFSMGHRKIAYVGTVLSTSSITDRYLGYIKAMMEHGEEIRQEWKIDDRDLETGIVGDKLIELPKEMPTAFFCNCDVTAYRLIHILEENGYHVPEDISVVGYDNYMLPGLANVEITSYEVDMKEMARRSVKMLIKKIRQENYRHGISIVEGHLVEKDSVKKILGTV